VVAHPGTGIAGRGCTGPSGREARPGREEGADNARGLADRLEDLVLGLGKVGCGKTEARERLERALTKLRAAGHADPTDNEILRAAV
jgi:hypothetical protein